MPPHHRSIGHGSPRAGTILIVVAGISALLVGMTIAYLARMRNDAEEMAVLTHETQARLMLIAGCNYIQETARLGYEPTASATRVEAFGWVDVRVPPSGSGQATWGPRDANGAPLWTPGSWCDLATPADRRPAARCPMYVMQRPPYAIQLATGYNPIRTPHSNNPVAVPATAADPSPFGMPYLLNPDPQPVTRNGWSGFPGSTVNGARWNDYANGDSSARANTLGMSWFRIFRDGPATFVVTCGGGGTQGFRDWDEVVAADQTALFGADEATFTNLRDHECRLWYRVEWSAAVMALDYHAIDADTDSKQAYDKLIPPPPEPEVRPPAQGAYDNYCMRPMNASHALANKLPSGIYVGEYRSQTHAKNFVGTIRWMQRLRSEPTYW